MRDREFCLLLTKQRKTASKTTTQCVCQLGKLRCLASPGNLMFLLLPRVVSYEYQEMWKIRKRTYIPIKSFSETIDANTIDNIYFLIWRIFLCVFTVAIEHQQIFFLNFQNLYNNCALTMWNPASISKPLNCPPSANAVSWQSLCWAQKICLEWTIRMSTILFHPSHPFPTVKLDKPSHFCAQRQSAHTTVPTCVNCS